MKKKEFILNIVYSVIPMVLIIPLSIWGLYQMEKATYDSFFVKGHSMDPTLSGDVDCSTYGRYDSSEKAIDNIERFDLVVCYYPFEGEPDYEQPYIRNQSKLKEGATLKIKRIIGRPNETLLIANDFFTITDNITGISTSYGPVGSEEEGIVETPFKRKEPISNRSAYITLGEDEYFVMGDNWTANSSTDCCNPPLKSPEKCIYKENIEGVIFRLDGYCTRDNDSIIEEHPFKDGPIYLK